MSDVLLGTRYGKAVGTAVAVLVAGSSVFVAPGTASAAAPEAAAATPSCNSYAQFDRGNGTHYRLPSVGWGGTVVCHLKRGNRNDGVKVLQFLIACNEHATLPDGSYVERDGDFGAKTEWGLRLVQADKGIKVDGVYGSQTRNATSWPIFNSNGIFVDCA